MFQMREGRAVVPGGARTEKAWVEIVRVGLDKGPAFFERLMARDDGWAASYYDALARINGPVKDYLTDPDRLKRFYTAIRGRVTSPGPARPVFRSNTDMMLLTTRLRLDASGKPHLPGGLDMWKNLFANHPAGKYDAKMIQALAGLWQILVRQNSISESESDGVLAELLTPFTKITGERDLFDAGRSGVKALLKATHSPENVSAQDRMLDLLAGTAAVNSTDSHQQLVEDMIRIFEAQRLVSLNTLFELADNLGNVTRGAKLNTALAGKLATRLSPIQLPRS